MGRQALAVCCLLKLRCVVVREQEKGLTLVMQTHSCAVTRDRELKCWGNNNVYQVIPHALLSVISCNCAFVVAGE
jgi:hypothetical protein